MEQPRRHQAGVGYSEVLATEVLDRLWRLDQIAAGTRKHTAAEVTTIREEMRRMIDMWRRLLSSHHPARDEPFCSRCPRRWGRRRRWPCAVWRTAHTALITHHVPGPAPAPDHSRVTDPQPPASDNGVPAIRQ
ncbi:MAG: hypothetical protein ACRDRL_14970 [Sciscionella sp.]